MTTFYICRHGQSEYNLQKRIQGQIDTPLTEKGIENAKTVANKVKNISFDTIFSSDLGRAFQTAYIIAHEIGFTKQIITSRELREGNFGDYAGLTLDEVNEIGPHVMGDSNFIPPNGESLNQIRERIMKFLFTTEEQYNVKTILLVSHDQVINSIYTAFKNIDMGEYNKDHFNPHDFVAKFVVEGGEIVSFEEV